MHQIHPGFPAQGRQKERASKRKYRLEPKTIDFAILGILLGKGPLATQPILWLLPHGFDAVLEEMVI